MEIKIERPEETLTFYQPGIKRVEVTARRLRAYGECDGKEILVQDITLARLGKSGSIQVYTKETKREKEVQP